MIAFHLPTPENPTQEGPRGIRFDFNDGTRVLLPPSAWHVQLADEESGNILFACDADEGWVVNTKKYYVPSASACGTGTTSGSRCWITS